MQYRSDIDGLRALAVLAVIAVHIGLPGLSGGFVGVDVFFVISGFLIFSLLVDEYENTGKISFADFYARRFKRLLPALSVVVASTIIAACILLHPVENQQGIMFSAIASMGFVANLYFWRTTGGYFDSSAESQPLLHLWSLGVEEQWYLVFPILLLFLLILVRRYFKSCARDSILFLILGVGALLSYVLCIWGTEHHARATFFILPTRAWEFLAGACSSLILRKCQNSIGSWQAQILSLVGIGGLLISFFLIKEGHHFPGSIAILPVIFTCCIIIAGKDHNSLAYKVFSLAYLRQLGKLSYSWYLWHWPLIVFPRILSGNHSNFAIDLFFGAIVSFIFAALTWKYIEQPARYKRFLISSADNIRIIRRGIALCVCVSVLGLIGMAYSDFLARKPSNLPLVEAIKPSSRSAVDYSKCMSRYLLNVPNELDMKHCLFGSSDSDSPDIVLWGDSHAGVFSNLLNELMMEERGSFLLRSRGACAPITDSMLLTRQGGSIDELCEKYTEAVFKEVLRSSVSGVVLIARWPRYTDDKVGSEPSEYSLFIGENRKILSRDEALDLIELRLDKLASGLERSGIRLLLVSPLPSLHHSAPHCLARRKKEHCSVSLADATNYVSGFLPIFEKLAGKYKNVRVWNPFELICNDSECPSVANGVVIYRDDNHLSYQGVLSLKRNFKDNVYDWLL